MEIRFLYVDDRHYVMNTRKSKNSAALQWDQEGGTHLLILSGAFGCEMDIAANEFREYLTDALQQLLEGRTAMLQNEIRATLITKSRHVQNGLQYSINNKPASYAVFCCVLVQDEDRLFVYVPQDDGCQHVARIRQDVRYTVEDAVKGLLRRRTGNLIVTVLLEEGGADDYEDGSLFYSFPSVSYQYPIMKSMIDAPFLLTNPVEELHIGSKNGGFRIVG
jgi:hypothetical protein